MFEALAEKLQALHDKLTREAVPYDPSQFGDELATRTSWGPAKSGGASFGTHRLRDAGPRRVEFRAKGGALAFYGVFVAMGLMALTVFPVAAFSTMGMDWRVAPFLIIPFLVGSVFIVVGGAMWYHGSAPIVFDKQRGEYWKGRVAPGEAANPQQIKVHIDLVRIHALQLISEHCRGSKSSFYSYELNLVLDDATRMNVLDHGDRDELRHDAEALAKFLGKPLWDATGSATA
ncbi:MAG: hypothetical protein ABL963_11485 [Longimicrobiales bacterium]